MRAISVLLSTSLWLSAADSPLTRGITAYHEGRYTDARTLLQNSQDVYGRTFLALTQAALGECETALRELPARFADAPDQNLARLAGIGAAQCYLAANDTTHAVPLIQLLQTRFPTDADVLFIAARAYMKAFNDTTFQMFQKTPASYRVNQLSGEILETQNRYAEAAAEYRKAITKSPRALNLHYRLGRALLLASHDPSALTAARTEFATELALNPSDAAAEFQLGQLLVAEGQSTAAQEHFAKALALRPDFPEALIAVAKAKADAKQYPEAITLLERAILSQPRNEAARYQLMLAYRNAGQTDKARQQKQELDRLQRPPEGEFSDFLKKLGEQPKQP